MSKETEALDKFLGDLGNNDKAELDLGQEEEKEETLETQPEEEKEEEKLPFHKDPKVQRYIDRQIDKRTKELQPTRQEQFVKEVQDDDPLIEAFTNIIGNDTPEKVNALKQLKRSIADVQDKAAEKAYTRFADEQRQIQAEERKAAEELTEGIERIEENFDVDLSSNSPIAKKTRNEFLDFVGRISPKNDFGEITEYADLEQAYETFKELRKPETNKQAKEIAARGMSRSSADATNTPSKRITFDNVREMMGLE